MEEEITLHEKIEAKRAEFCEKYADVINDLLAKYGGTVDRGYDYLTAIARGVIYDVECDYSTDIEYNQEEMIEDYKVIEALSKQSIGE